MLIYFASEKGGSMAAKQYDSLDDAAIVRLAHQVLAVYP